MLTRKDDDDHERTLVCAEIALGQIKALRQPANPRNYEIWYTYASAQNPPLNKAVNEALARSPNGLSAADLEIIYDNYLSPTRLADRIETLSARMAGKIDGVRATLESAVDSASTYSENLADASVRLGGAQDSTALHTVIQDLIVSSKKMEQVNHTLEAKLKASAQEISQLHEDLEAARTESLTDPLTSLANRKYFDQALRKAIVEAEANGEQLSLILADIDHFKTFNDSYGHLTGDQVLRLVALSIKQNVKGQDLAARYGGEEFAIVLPSTPLRQAITVGDHIRRAVTTKELMKRSTGETLGRVTISVGVAVFHRGESAQALIGRADACLYAAKRSGRNCVICETDPEVVNALPSATTSSKVA